MQKLKVLTIDEQLEKFNNYRTQRNQAARNFKLRNKEKIENEWKKAYEINRNNPEFKERSKQRAKTYYELNRDAICLKAKTKNQLKKASKLKTVVDNVIKIEPTELKLKRGRPKKI